MIEGWKHIMVYFFIKLSILHCNECNAELSFPIIR